MDNNNNYCFFFKLHACTIIIIVHTCNSNLGLLVLLTSLYFPITTYILCTSYVPEERFELPLFTYFLSGLHSGGMRPLVLHCLCALNPQSEMRGKDDKNY